MDQFFSNIKQWDSVLMFWETKPYTVQCRDDRYIICTRPYKSSVMYTIIDLGTGMVSTDNSWNTTYQTIEDCMNNLWLLQEWEIELSRRNSISIEEASIILP